MGWENDYDSAIMSRRVEPRRAGHKYAKTRGLLTEDDDDDDGDR